MELIDKAVVLAEIERQLHYVNSWLEGHKRVDDRRSNVYFRMLDSRNVLESIKDFINNLEIKEADLQSEVTKWLRNNENVIHMEFARHFFELGLKAREDKE